MVPYDVAMRLALAQMNPTIGAIAANALQMGEFLDRAREAGADLVLFPELTICGYPPKDLLLQEGFIQACAAAAKEVGEQATKGLTAVFGCPLPVDQESPDGRIANSLLVYRDGAYVDYYDKRLLPTYDVFDEDRYFTPGDRAVVIEVAGVKVGLAICEDLWKGMDAGFNDRYVEAADPVGAIIERGAQMMISPSASPFVLGKGQSHRRIIEHHAMKHGLWIASLNQVGGNDELIFDGHGVVLDPGGDVVAAAQGFEEELLVVDLPIGDLGGAGEAGGAAVATKDGDPLLDACDEALLFAALKLGVADYLGKTGFSKAIVGLSGGIDSAVTAAIAAAAIGPENVTGVAMPGPYSSEHSVTDADLLAKRLGMTLVNLPIAAAFNEMAQTIDAGFGELELARLGEKLPDVTEQNLQARIRGTILMAMSNRTGAIVLTTGNKSELAVGYCTLYGDMNGGLAVLSDVPKQRVYALSRWMNEHFAAAGFKHAPIPLGTIDKPPSAELAPDQLDQDSLPEYDVLDEIIERYVEGRQSAARIAGETGFDSAVVGRMTRLIDVNEYKRRQMATGLKVTSVAFGTGRRMPIAQGWRGFH